MLASIMRALKTVGIVAVAIPFIVIMLALAPAAIAFCMWLFGGGGIVEILRTIVATAEACFKHDWKMAEVVLVLLLLFLMVRKR